MYSVMLVDDEPWSLMGMHNLFHWKKHGFEVVQEFNDSVQALEKLCEFSPDVMFTDIRMPTMSGIELMKKAREKGIKTEFVILSGFAEFTYAQESVKLGAFDYCLKPMNFIEADELLKKLAIHFQGKLIMNSQEESQDSINLDQINLNENFDKLLKYVKSNYEKKIYLKDLASQFFINYTYCSEMFKKITGCNFSEYLVDLRIRKACELLKVTTLSVDEICKKTGFEDYYYFSKLFKRKCEGLTPAQYRKKNGA